MNYSLDDVDLTILASLQPDARLQTLNWQKNVDGALCSAGTRKETGTKRNY